MRTLISALFIISLFALTASANPFMGGGGSGGGKDPGESPAPLSVQGPEFTASFAEKLIELQRKMNSSIADTADDIKRGNTGKTAFILLLCFLYGIVHAAGPGHGKSVISSYIFSYGGSFRKAIAAGYGTGIVHALSAVILISSILFIFRNSALSRFTSAETVIQKGTITVILILSAVMIIHALSEIIKMIRKDKNEAEDQKDPGRGSFPAAVILSGIIPCPGAAMILLFTSDLGLYSTGLLSVAAMSLGMGTTISAASITAAGIRKAGRRASPGRISPALFSSLTELTGGLVLLAAAALFFQAA